MATMTHILVSTLYFVVLIGVVVFIHELGHFLVARAVGVTVLKFSLGFGPKLVGYTRKGTEFLISAVPLGGYCKFLGDDPEKPLADGDRKKGFLTTDIWRRTLIVLAGPMFNLILPLLVFLPIMLTETSLPPAIIGSVSVGGPAWEGGLRDGDTLVSIDGKPVRYWHEMVDIVSDNPGAKLKFVVRRPAAAGQPAGTKTLVVTPRTIDDPYYRRIGFSVRMGQIEVLGQRPRPILSVTPGSAAHAAGLRDFDSILDIDGRRVWTFDEVMTTLAARPGQQVTINVSRLDMETFDGTTAPDRLAIKIPVPADLADPAGAAAFGLSDGSLAVARVSPDSPAAEAGFRKGDRITALDGRTFVEPHMMVLAIQQEPDADHVFTVARADGPADIRVNLKNPEWQPGSSRPQHLSLGVTFRVDQYEPPAIPNDNIVGYAMKSTWQNSVGMYISTVASLGAVVTGRVSFKEMGGPIMIFDLAGKAGQQGLIPFIQMLLFISVSLGVMNLLPIPLLDGGHLVMFVLEKVRRRAPTMRERNIWGWIGLVILALLMLAVMKNDIFRLIS